MQYHRLIRELTRPQVLEPQTFARITGDVFAREPASDLCGGEVERPGMEILDGLAVIPVHGVLARNLDQIDLYGATDYNEIQDELREATAQGVDGIVLEFDSPGGSVSGVMETARMIAASKIPTVAFVNDAAYSAAYWLASQCDYVIALDTAGVGSIGVYLPIIYDFSRALAEQGVDVHFVRSGKHKASGAFPAVGISEEELEEMRADVVRVHELFKAAILEQRPDVPLSAMEGQTYFGEDALRLQLIDATISDRHEFIAKVKALLDAR